MPAGQTCPESAKGLGNVHDCTKPMRLGELVRMHLITTKEAQDVQQAAEPVVHRLEEPGRINERRPWGEMGNVPDNNSVGDGWR